MREPLQSELAGMKMFLTPPPTSGAVLGLILNILKGRLVFCSPTPPPHHHHHHYHHHRRRRHHYYLIA